jgi:ABC-type transporter Mla subunit MlaD
MVAVTDALAKSIEDTKSFVDTASEKMQKASSLLDDNVKTANQARKDYEEVRKMLGEAKADVIDATKTLTDGAHAASDGDLPGLVAAIAEGVPKVTAAVAKYTKVVADLKTKAENYKKAVEGNVQVVKTF